MYKCSLYKTEKKKKMKNKGELILGLIKCYLEMDYSSKMVPFLIEDVNASSIAFHQKIATSTLFLKIHSEEKFLQENFRSSGAELIFLDVLIF